MINYDDLVSYTLYHGSRVTGRNGATRSVFGRQLQFFPSAAFPIVTKRQIFYKGVLGELAALLKGPTNIEDFKKEGCHYWDKWADEDGAIRLAYGNAWRDFNGANQLENLINNLRSDPHSRRHLIVAWDPANLDSLSSQCCHYAYQWRVDAEGYLDMIWIQRSVDLMIGLPSDTVFAAVFHMLVANTVGLKVGALNMQLGDCHIYEEHFDKAVAYLDRQEYEQPTGRLAASATVDNFEPSMFTLEDYNHSGPISFELKK